MDRLGAAERMAAHYLRYALLWSTEYTNIKSDAEGIAFFTLLAAGSVAGKLGLGQELAWLIECVAEAVARRGKPGSCCVSQDGSFRNPDPLLPNERMLKLARAVNMLDTSPREVLLLYHMGMMSTRKISEILGQSISQVRLEIAVAERKLLQHFAGLYRTSPAFMAPDVCVWLGELGDVLDETFEQDGTKPAVSRLAGGEDPFQSPHGGFALWNVN
jgi:hypothetical protein